MASSDILKRREQSTKARRKCAHFITTVASIYGCQVCNESDPKCIDFHHLEDRDLYYKGPKEADTRYMIKNKWSLQRITQELTKCAPLCSNCHRKHHAKTLYSGQKYELKNIEYFSLQAIKKLVESSYGT